MLVRQSLFAAIVLVLLTGAPVANAQEKPAAAPLSVLYEQGKHHEGLDWLQRFGKGTAEEKRYRGLFHYRLGHADAALEHLLAAYRAGPHDDTVALALTEVCLWKKDVKTAKVVIAKLQAPEEPEALRVRGMVLELDGRLADALALYERAIPRAKQPWGTLERKALVLSWLKRFDEAMAAYAKVAESNAASWELRQRCRVRMAELTAWKKDFAGALAQLDKLLQGDPRLIPAWLLKGQILEWSGRFGDAKGAYSRILAIDPKHAEAKLRLNKLLWMK
jgi:tetratricopeptide (TPR) repeat protein